MKNAALTFFTVMGTAFTAAMLVLTLMTNIECASLNDTAAQLSSEISALEAENKQLQAEYDNSLSLEELEKYASEVLGMRHPAPGQIVYTEYTG